ncbi:helix-turn-helix transcriptional regulator [Sphingobacterium sp.]|uniref:helix-turn-helix domain-containing protein n=1 Tax=Sphingobacterium sp. TaxID=341027 RepID=UPI0031E05BF0
MGLNRLKEIFKKHKIQNRIIAKYFGKSEETISKWVNNKRQPSVEELNAIARLLRINVRLLLSETTWENETSETYDEVKKRFKEDADKTNT